MTSKPSFLLISALLICFQLFSSGLLKSPRSFLGHLKLRRSLSESLKTFLWAIISWRGVSTVTSSSTAVARITGSIVGGNAFPFLICQLVDFLIFIVLPLAFTGFATFANQFFLNSIFFAIDKGSFWTCEGCYIQSALKNY